MLGAFHILADATTAPGTTSQPAPAAPVEIQWQFDASNWAVTGSQLVGAAITASIVMIVGLILLILLRNLLIHAKLRVAAGLLIIFIAGYVFVLRAEAKPMADHTDILAWWLHRGFAALFVIAGLRFLDRLIIVPILTRGGKLPLSRLLHQIVNTVVAVFAILAFGSYAFGWDIDKFLAGSAVVSIVLGLALQESLGNFFSGLVMQGSPPFKLGDWIVCGDHQGSVIDMNWRAVTIQTDDGNYIMIPNANIARSELINHNAPSSATRRSIRIGMEYENAPFDVIACLNAAARESLGVLPEPPPETHVSEFGDSALYYEVRFWIADPRRYREIEHRVRQNMWYRLREQSLSISFSTTLDLSNLDERQKRQEALRLAAREHAIGRVSVLSPLSKEQRRTLADLTHEILLAPGQILFRQGDSGDTFYIIFQGKVEVLIDVGGADKVIATLGPGDFFGEMAALTGQPRRATIRAVEHLTLIEVEKEDLMKIFETDRSILEKISGIIVQRDAERDAAAKSQSPPPVAVMQQQKQSMLNRMLGWFGLR